MASLNPLSIPGGWKKDTPVTENQDPAESVPRSATGNSGGDQADENGVGRQSVADFADATEGHDSTHQDERGTEYSIHAGESAAEAPVQMEDRDGEAGYDKIAGGLVEADGRVVSRSGMTAGSVVDGDAAQIEGSKVGDDGTIRDLGGEPVGKAEPQNEAEEEKPEEEKPEEEKPEEEKPEEEKPEEKPEEEKPGEEEIEDHAGDYQKEAYSKLAGGTVESEGRVTSKGELVGTVVEGDAKALEGNRVGDDGTIRDINGNPVGKAEPREDSEVESQETEELEEEQPDRSILEGKRVNKAGNVVDESGAIFGRVVEGDVASIAGRMCDKDGNVRSESGSVVGKAEVLAQDKRQGPKEGPFAELECTVGKDGKVVTASGDTIGRIVSGDANALFGRVVDQDGDILDRNGNVIGKAERWEEPVVEKPKSPLAGRKVNREGDVVDDDGNIIGRLVSGDKTMCSGKEVDDDGDVTNSKGNTLGHVALLEDIPPEPESAEEREEREKAQKDRELAGKLAGSIEQSLDKLRPILKLITDKIDRAERTPKEELDEEQLVREVKPLIEEGAKVLTETNGMIRGMDPDGRIQRNAKHKTSTKEATPEEHHLAEMLKELTTSVTETIDNAKRKIEGMPHAKKELNPLWGLLTEPLFQIIAAVGLLLNGVLGLVGRLLSGLGLGGLVENILGGLGIDKILASFGLGSAWDALTGRNQK
ncbi:Protein of unknown function (DUF3659) [Geosmithia morbida]|uniref:DUF6987 domain-containing protein n=1 Tax=Geosmithia morbida TaxID=1094350 RepID=A0A9P4YN88_9HYPO|nr:Protein of unknown function (DUF3659) [Geosmithia morbida]KAF4119577.1 Protein of unknown function (DUF3659) [Geosmithia morbida]